jgi:hypothetical protein
MGSGPLLYVNPLDVNFTKFGLPPRSTSGGPYASKGHTLALALTIHLFKNIALIGHSSS